MKYHIIAFFLGFLLDLLLGDPYCFPHPIRLIGSLIAKLDKWLCKKDDPGNEKMKLSDKNKKVYNILDYYMTWRQI